MNITTLTNLGDKIWPISRYQKETIKTCPACKGTKKVVIDGQTYLCPNRCHGGKIREYGPVEFRTQPAATIDEIEVRCAAAPKSTVERAICYTGVGCGIVYIIGETAFVTKEQADAACKLRNEKGK